MNGIKMSDCKFYADKDAGVVICVIPNTDGMLWDFLHDNCKWHDINMYYAVEGALEEQLYLPDSFVGKAVCAPEDEWNEETGRLIAYARAKDKCYKSFFKRANKLVQTVDKRLENMITIFNDFGVKLEDRRTELHQKIDKALETE